MNTTKSSTAAKTSAKTKAAAVKSSASKTATNAIKKAKAVRKPDAVFGQVFETRDYARFKFMENNRAINGRLVEQLRQSIEKNGQIMPIAVNANFLIVDGQHRFLALSQLRMPIQYIKKSGTDMFDIIELNTCRTNWSKADYLRYYVHEGVEAYKTLAEFMGEFPKFSQYTCERILSTSRPARDTTKYPPVRRNDFERGKFNIISLEASRRNAERIMDFAPYERFMGGLNDRSFVTAALKMLSNPNYNHVQMQNQMEAYPSVMYRCVDHGAYTKMFEVIFNYNQRKKVSFGL